MRTIYVKEYVRADGTVVRAHTRRIEEVGDLVSDPIKREDLKDFVKEILMGIPDKKNQLAQKVAQGVSNIDYSTILKTLQQLHVFEKFASMFQTLINHGMDTSEAEQGMSDVANDMNIDSSQNMESVPESLNVPQEVIPDITNVDNEFSIEGMPTGAAINMDNISKNSPCSVGTIGDAIFSQLPAKINKNAIVLDNIDKIKNPKLVSILKNKGVKNNEPGVYYDANSVLSKKIVKSKELNIIINQNINKLKNGEKIKLISGEFKNDKDLFLSIQHFDIHDLKLENNRITGYIVDRYDFDGIRKGKTIPNLLNNTGYVMQDYNLLKPYFIIVQFDVSLSDVK